MQFYSNENTMQIPRGGGETKKANRQPDCDENKASFLFFYHLKLVT